MDFAWKEDAACRDHDPDDWFANESEPGAVARAKAICADCPVRGDCLDFALRAREAHGIWGGLDVDERSTLLGKPLRVKPRTMAERRAAGWSSLSRAASPDDVETAQRIAREAARRSGIPLAEMLRYSQEEDVVRWRTAAMAATRRATDLSLQDVARVFDSYHGAVARAWERALDDAATWHLVCELAAVARRESA